LKKPLEWMIVARTKVAKNLTKALKNLFFSQFIGLTPNLGFAFFPDYHVYCWQALKPLNFDTQILFTRRMVWQQHG
jgi:hypothetical protein